VSFGLVGYRDNLTAAPGLEYDVKTFVNLTDGANADAFLAGINTMTEAKSTSTNFREDSYAGIDHALRDMDWSGFGARYIVLVTDAGPREAGDDLSKTGLTGRALNSLVAERLGAALAVMHLKTPSGARDHASAESAYRELTRQSNQAALYFAVPDGNPDSYMQAARQLGQVVVEQVAQFRSGIDTDTNSGTIAEAPAANGNADAGDPLTAAMRSAGRTMQLAYLGRETGTQAPDVFEAYIADRDFDRPGLKPLSIRLLLSKSELSDLDESVRLILRKGDENILSPDQLFNQVLSAAADMSRRPDKVSRNADTTLADAVSVSEMLDGLPYQSQIMAVTEDDWLRMNISEQQSILGVFADKVELYARFNESTDQWVNYLGSGAQGDALLYPMKLDDLP
jgi:serine/threonine-protein kinase PpkA